MIKIEKTEVYGWKAAIRGMRNPKNSWANSDTDCDNLRDFVCGDDGAIVKAPVLGEKDLNLVRTLNKAGSDHAKFMRYIDVTFDLTAPLEFWKEFKTYRAGRKFADGEQDQFPYIYDSAEISEFDIETDSCSTMHKIMSKEFTADDFSNEFCFGKAKECFDNIIGTLNYLREKYINGGDMKVDGEILHFEPHDKRIWRQVIDLLPESYNQKRTVKMSYQTLWNINRVGRRKDHKLYEWREFCNWVDTLPNFVEMVNDKVQIQNS